MTRDELLNEACQRCEEYSTYTECEAKNDCPVYKLYLLADPPVKKRRNLGWDGVQGSCDFEPHGRPEMI